MPSQPLIINNFDQAVADSPHKGFGLMRNVDLEPFPGALRSQRAPASLFGTAFSSTFTAVAGTDICTVGAGTVPSTGTAVTVSTSGTLPSPLAASTTYFIIKLSASTFKLATTIALANAGTAIDLTTDGTGTQTVTTINPGQINHIVIDPRSDVQFFLDSNGRVWYYSGSMFLLSGNTLTNASGQGLAIFGNSNLSATYLFVFRNAVIDVINVFGTSNRETPVWNTAWQSLNTGAGSSNSHHAINGQDGLIYFCDTRYVGSIREVPGMVFDPATPATYTYNNQALDMPQNEVNNWLEELGVNLLVAGNTFNKIYPWDRVSDSYNLPLDVPEVSVKRLKNIGQIVYILAGSYGNIYLTQGTYVKHFKKIPDQMINNSGNGLANPVTWGGIAAVNGALLVGLSGQNTENNGAYIIYPDGKLILDHVVSAVTPVRPTAFLSNNRFYTMGYSGGADSINTSLYSNFECVVQSELYRVADKTTKATFSNLEVVLAKPVSASGSVRVSYRPDTSSAFTTLDTFVGDSSTIIFDNDQIGLIDLTNIQVQLEYHGPIEIVEIRLIP